MSSTARLFTELVRARRSPRQFLPAPLSPSDIRGVLEDAQTAPSSSNTQPWTVHIVSGAARDALSKELLKAYEDGRTSSAFTVDYGEGVYRERSFQHGALVYGARGPFGIGDRTSPMYDVGVGRVPLRQSVVVHGTHGVLDEQEPLP